MLPVAAAAQPLDALVSEALRNNREILAAQKKYEALRQRPAQESSLPDPTVSLGYASNGGPWPGAGLGTNPTSNLGVSFSQEVPFPGKQRLRGEIAGREAEAGWDEYRAVRLSVVSRLKQAYHELHHAMVDIEFVERNQELLRNILSTAEARYAVGRAAQQDVSKRRRNSRSSRPSGCATSRSRPASRLKSTPCSTGPSTPRISRFPPR